MSKQLAINGGPKAFSQATLDRVPSWPPIYPRVPDMLKKVYTSRAWSFNSKAEQELCSAFAAYHDAERGVFMVNGTVTLECALAALGVGKGDEVIVPALTWLATAMAAVYLGAKPVFVDIEPDTLCLDPKKLKTAITKKTKAIIPVHIYGSMADMEAILDIAGKHGIPIIEDCAHAHGGKWAGKGVGSLGAIGSFSFQESKPLPSGEGGMCITNDSDLAGKLYRLKHIGYDFVSGQGHAGSSPQKGLVCHNYRSTGFEATILLESLKYLREQTQKRDDNAKYLKTLLEDIPGIRIQSRGRRADVQSYYSLGFLFDLPQFNQISLERLLEVFNAEGLGLRKTYGPVYKHLLWNIPSSMYRKADACSVCEKACSETALTLMHNWLLTDKKLMCTIAKVMQKVWNYRKELC